MLSYMYIVWVVMSCGVGRHALECCHQMFFFFNAKDLILRQSKTTGTNMGVCVYFNLFILSC